MKTTLLYIGALLLAFSLPTLADTKTVMGCEIVPVEGGGYYNKADSDCVYRLETVGGSQWRSGDYDNDPTTPDTVELQRDK